MKLPFISRFLQGKSLNSVSESGQGWRTIWESFTGAFQRNVDIKTEDVLANHAVFSCNSLISGSVAKARLMVERKKGRIWEEVPNHKLTKLLRKPNAYQNRIQFVQHWILSKLIFGNAYILKRRDIKNNVIALYVLHPDCVSVLVSDSGEVYYKLSHDKLSKIENTSGVTVPATEIIHDRYNTFYHPLVGVSPIYAAGLPAVQALEIQRGSAKFFQNRGLPSGILVAPTRIADEDAQKLSEAWNKNYSGDGAGKIAVLGQDLKFQPVTTNAVDAQLIEQLQWSAEIVASVYHVPSFMIGAGEAPKYDNINALGQQFYSQCLQIYIESLEMCLDDGLGVKANERVSVNLKNLIRMDSAAQIKQAADGIGAGLLAPDEAREGVNLPPVPGGQYPFLQQQYHSLEDLAKLRAREAADAEQAPEIESEDVPDEVLESLAARLNKGFDIDQ